MIRMIWRAVRIPAVDCYGRFHCFRTIKNDPRIQIRIGDTVEHVLADVFDRLVIRVFEGENQMVDAILRGPDDFRSAIIRFIACGSSDQRDLRIVLAVALADIVEQRRYGSIIVRIIDDGDGI